MGYGFFIVHSFDEQPKCLIKLSNLQFTNKNYQLPPIILQLKDTYIFTLACSQVLLNTYMNYFCTVYQSMNQGTVWYVDVTYSKYGDEMNGKKDFLIQINPSVYDIIS